MNLGKFNTSINISGIVSEKKMYGANKKPIIKYKSIINSLENQSLLSLCMLLMVFSNMFVPNSYNKFIMANKNQTLIKIFNIIYPLTV